MSAAVVRIMVGQPPLYSTRAIRSRNWSRASQRTSPRSAPAKRPMESAAKRPELAASSTHSVVKVMPSSSSATLVRAEIMPGVSSTSPETATSAARRQ